MPTAILTDAERWLEKFNVENRKDVSALELCTELLAARFVTVIACFDDRTALRVQMKAHGNRFESAKILPPRETFLQKRS
jgi:hypothetical protein